MTSRLKQTLLVLMPMLTLMLCVAGCGGTSGVEIVRSATEAPGATDDLVAAPTVAAARSTEAAAEATKAAAVQAIAQATTVIQFPPTGTPTTLATQAPVRTATDARMQAPAPVTEKVEPQGERFYLHADGILAMAPPPSNSRSHTECFSECTQTWAITLTHPLQGNAYGYDLVGIGGDFNVRLLHARGGQQTVLAEWLNCSGWQGGPQIDALPGDVLTLEITLALGKSWQPFSAGSILAFDYGSYSYVTVGTTQEPLPTYPPPPTPTPVGLDTSTAMQIRYGDVITEEIMPSGNMDIYTFDGKAGDVAFIVAAGTDDAPWLSLQVELFDHQGQPVVTESRGRGEYHLTADGCYTFTVREAGTRTGPYNVVLKNVAPGAGVRLAYGDAVEAEIAIAGETDVYTVAGKAGDQALVALSQRPLESNQGNLVVEVVDPQGQPVAQGDIWVGNTATILHTLAVDGAYDIRVWITGQLDSPKTGAYTLLLKNVSPAAGTKLSYGTVVTGTVKPAGDRDVYLFDWKSGDVPIIEATKGRDCSFAEFVVEVFDSQGNSLALGSAPFGVSSIKVKPSLSTEGTYTIVVREEHQVSGFYTGSYSLLLVNLAAPIVQEALVLDTNADRVYCVAWSPDGTRLASAGNSRIHVWDAASGEQVHTLSLSSEAIASVAWSADGTQLASGGDSHTVRVWDAAGERKLHELEGHTNWVSSTAWAPDGTRLASGSGDGTVRVWEITSGAELRVLEGHAGPVVDVAWSPDGTQLATAGGEDGMIRVWDVASGAELRVLKGRTDEVRSVAWSPNGTRLASGSGDGTVRVWDAAGERELHVLDGHTDWVRSVAWSPDGTRLASGSDDGTVRLWDAASGTELCVLFDSRDENMYGFSVYSVAWSPDGTRLAWGGADDTVRVWSVAGCQRWYRP